MCCAALHAPRQSSAVVLYLIAIKNTTYTQTDRIILE